MATHFDGAKLETGAGSGITTGTGTLYRSSVFQTGGIIVTQIMLDITGLTTSSTVNDIIGVENAASCHLGQIVKSESGTMFAGDFICLESPGTADPDINIYAADESTGAEDSLITALTNDTLLVNAGDWVNGTRRGFSALPANNQHLYLAVGTATAGTYTAGKAIITLYGYVTDPA